MRQEELEEKVRDLFVEQGFEVEGDGNRLIARNEDLEKKIQVFSSEEFSVEDVKHSAGKDSLVFVDGELSGVRESIENQVSVIQEEREKPDYDLPSYEVIGNVAVINELDQRDKEEVVEGILEHNPHVKTILVKREPLSGEYRTGEYEKLHGDATETVHKEFGCRFRVDPTRVYFSERFATERKRVVDQIDPGEKVLVIGAGVGPFAVLAAKHSEPEKAVAVEKNPEAVEYLEENIDLNNVGDTVEAVEGDAREIDLGERFHRIIIPIPEMADQFLETAFDHLEDGGIIHYYRFLESENWEELEEEILRKGKKVDFHHSIKDKIICGQRGPTVDRVCVEIVKSSSTSGKLSKSI